MPLRVVLGILLVFLAVGCAGSGSDVTDPVETEDSAVTDPVAPTEPSEPEVGASEEAAEPQTADEASEPEAPTELDEEALRAQDPGELEAVVRAWSEALNSGDDESAAELFAAEALVIQGDLAIALRTFEEALRFNDGLPCSGTIIRLSTESPVVIAVFELGDRPDSTCNAEPGTLAAAQFLIEDGKIVIWRQIPVPGEDAGQAPEDDVPSA